MLDRASRAERLKGGKGCRNEVRIDETDRAFKSGNEAKSKTGFTSSVWSRDDVGVRHRKKELSLTAVSAHKKDSGVKV